MKTADILPGSRYVVVRDTLRRVTEWEGRHVAEGIFAELWNELPEKLTLDRCLRTQATAVEVEVLEVGVPYGKRQTRSGVRCRLVDEGDRRTRRRIITDDGYVLEGYLQTLDGEDVREPYRYEFEFVISTASLWKESVSYEAEKVLTRDRWERRRR